MNKAIVLGIFGLLAISSCTKSYVCECTEPTGNGNKHIDLSAKNDSDAEALCAAEEGPSYGYVFTCELQ